MQEWLINLSTNHTIWVYIFIVFFAFAEGPYLSLVLGVVLKFGYFSFIPVYLALMFGDLIGDVFWYYVGYFYGHGFIKIFGKYFSITEQNIEKVKIIFHKYKHPILFISKITNGFGFALATLMTAGMVKLPFSRYISINIVGQFIWTGFLLGVGYFFGKMYIEVGAIIGKMFVVALFVVFVVAFIRFKKYLENKSSKLGSI